MKEEGITQRFEKNRRDADSHEGALRKDGAEAAFRTHKSDLSIRPIWLQKEERVLAHNFVCCPTSAPWMSYYRAPV